MTPTLGNLKLFYLPISILFLFGVGVKTTFAEMEEPIYTAVSSKVIYPYSTYNISVFIEPSKNSTLTQVGPTRVRASLSSETELFSSQELPLLPGKGGVLQILTEGLKGSEYNLTVTVFDAREKKYEKTGKVFASRKDRSILIQSDKPIYKPGETVQFRVLILDRELKPLKEEQVVDIKIFDGQRNLIKLLDGVRVQHGFYRNKLELSSEPILGDWNIEVKTHKKGTKEVEDLMEGTQQQKQEEEDAAPLSPGSSSSSRRVSAPRGGAFISGRPVVPPGSDDGETTKTQSFSVDQYVLPKYKVEIKPPSVITYKSLKFPVRVEAKYTYGKGVEGQSTLVVKRAYYYRYGNDENDELVSKSFPLNGSETVEVDVSSLFRKKDDRRYEQELTFEATVTEEITGKELKGSASARIFKNEYKVQQVKQTDKIKPGLPYSAIFKVSTQDDIPVHDESASALKVKHGFSFDAESGHFEKPIPSSGLVSLTFPTPTNELIQAQRIDLQYKDLKTSFRMPSLYESNSGVYMQIQRKRAATDPVTDELTDPVATVNAKMIVNVNATQPFSSINYVIHGHQDILASSIINLPQPTTDYDLEIICPEKADPEARIIVYTVLSESNEVLADSLKFSARKLEQDNFLNITLSEKQREPGQNVTLKLDTLKGSIVALRGVDQSVLLLKEDKDITQGTLDDEVRARENEAVWLNRNWGGSDAFKIFEEGGLVIITNANIHAKEHPDFGASPAGGIYNTKVAAFALSDSAGLRGGPSQGEIRVRSNFPETWLWEEVALNESNTLELHKTVPDTLTSWIITGYSLNSDSGIGVLQAPQKLTTFRPFFLSLNLPYSVVKGEVLLLQVLVHNYLGDKEVTAEVTLDNAGKEFQFAESSIKDAAEHKSTIQLKANGVSSVKFAIIPQKFGFITLKVVGTAGSMAGDALSQPLRVVPPGQRQERSTARLHNPSVSEEKTPQKLEAGFPEERVEGADKVKLTLISDILGPTLTNMDKLLQMPTGCGEQNMMSFVADIVILDYLKASQSLDETTRSKAIKYLESGYQRQLTYRHYDGSYSAFGNSDSTGSTWLTAFVVRSFIQAKPYITVDDEVIKGALDFLAKQQTSAGGFFEIGRVFSKSLQGGSHSNGVALTAYVLLAFVEARNNWNAPPETAPSSPGEDVPVDRKLINSQIVDKAISFVVEKTKSGEIDDVYALVISTYAAHLADHPAKDELFAKMLKVAKKDQGFVYWEVEKKNVTTNSTEEKTKLLWEYYIPPVTVEMTSYALLTYVLRNDAPNAVPSVRWLLNQRNSYGGFLSTQDTVVGLTALSKYAALTKTKNTNLQVEYNPGSGAVTVPITATNAQVLQEYELPATTRSVDVKASGEGAVLSQLTWVYYVEQPVRAPAFALQVNATKKGESDLALQVCTSYLQEGSSNMAIVEVNLPSGYVFDSDSLDELKSSVTNYKRHDVENQNTKLELYLDTVSSEEICIPLVANRAFKVGKQAPAYVSVYDYYDTTQTARSFYSPPQLSVCDICKESNDCDENNCV